jgi:hypothetical protein
MGVHQSSDPIREAATATNLVIQDLLSQSQVVAEQITHHRYWRTLQDLTRGTAKTILITNLEALHDRGCDLSDVKVCRLVLGNLEFMLVNLKLFETRNEIDIC